MNERATRSGAATKPSRLPALTGMRFIAAAMVFFFHALYMGFIAPEGSQETAHALFYQGGWTGVGFFFVLSGFVLTWSMRTDDTTPAFFRRRFFKIYPLHLVTLIVATVLMVWVWQAEISGWDAVLHVLLLHAWSPDIMVRAGFNGVAWSLSCEVFFYALFPVLIRVIDRIRPERLWAWAGAVVAGIFAVPFIADLLPNQEPVPPMVGVTAADLWFVYQFPGTRLLDFVFGIILARVVLEGRKLPLSFGGALALAVAAYAVAPLFPASFHMVAVMVVPLGLLVACAAKDESAGRSNWLSSRVMVWLGEVSFAFYITHQIVQVYGHRLLGGKSWDTPQAIGVIALLFGVTLLVSWLLFTLIERPVMRRYSTSRRRARTRAAEQAGSEGRTDGTAEERLPSRL